MGRTAHGHATPTPTEGYNQSQRNLHGFAKRVGLGSDTETLRYLGSLTDDILSTVMEQFDPSGCRDGNVLGRLQGYVRLLTSRKKTQENEGRNIDGDEATEAARQKGEIVKCILV